MRLSACVCVCVCERERESNQFRGGGKNRLLTLQSNIPVFALYDRIEYKKINDIPSGGGA